MDQSCGSVHLHQHLR